MNPQRAIDFHIHIAIEEHGMWTPRTWSLIREKYPEMYRDMKSYMTEPDAFVSFLKGQSLSGAVILAEDTVATGLVPNDYVFEFCRDHPSFLFPFMTFNPNRTGAFEKDREKFKRNVLLIAERVMFWQAKGFRGIKDLSSYNRVPFDTELMFPVWEAACRLKLPVLFHTGESEFDSPDSRGFGDPSGLAVVAENFPELTIIIAHCGSKKYFRTAYELAKRYPNVQLELSGIPPRSLGRHFCSQGMSLDDLSEKILFGTDYPAFPGGSDGIRKNVEAMRKIAESGIIKEDTAQKILYENAARILKID